MGELGINQSQLAKRLNVKPPVISEMLNEARTPQRRNWKKWADALETSPEWLMGAEPVAPAASDRALSALLAHAESVGLSEKKLEAIRLILAAGEADKGLHLALEQLRSDAAASPMDKRKSAGA